MENTQHNIDICVIAHNEQMHIQKCLRSIVTALDVAKENVRSYNVSIVNNGSADNSQEIIDAFCRNKPNWNGFEIELGDKANAFNLGLFKYSNASNNLTLFVDGDCAIKPESILSLLNAYTKNPAAYILAGIPVPKGSYSQQTIDRTLKGKALSGALFAISPSFTQKAIETGFKLPFGLIGDDSLLAWVASHDFKLSNGEIDGKLVGVNGAVFDYHRLVPNSWSNIKLYWRRLNRYSLRHLQQKCIRKFLNQHDDFGKLPSHIQDLYHLHKPEHCRTDSWLNRYLDSCTSKKIIKQSCK